jgi:hypothetical protein
LEKKVKACERELASEYHVQIVDALWLALEELRAESPSLLTLTNDDYQADSMIEKLLMGRVVDAVIGNDTDISVVCT